MKYKLVNKDIKKDYVYELLKSRGVENIQNFLNPSEDSLQSFEDLFNINIGVDFFISNIDKNKPLAVIVDCDVDGFTSASIIYLYIKKLNPEQQIDYYIHNGKQHGLEDMWEKLQDKNYSLIIIPDAASNDSEYASKISTPILVLDHHIVEGEITAKNMVVINNQLSPKYRNKNLSGAGMAYQFCRALDKALCVNYADDFIDLAAVGVIGDMMSGLEVENQFLWKKGLSSINNFFLKTLIDKQSYSMGGKINPISIAFYIVPLINAMIRVGTQEEKERMFIAFIDGERQIPCNKRGAKGTFERAAIESARECTNAKAKQTRILDTAEGQIEIKIYKYDLLENKILLIRLEEDDTFPPELNGLLAMRMAAKYKRPTIVARLNDQGYIRGSIRGVNNGPIDSFKNFLTESGYCEYVMGHDNAAGISIKNSDLEKLHCYANQKLANIKLDEDCYDVNFVRAAADTDICDIISNIVEYEDIWSQNNEEPRLYIHDINISQDDIQIIGKNKDTVKFTKFGITYIKFHAEDLIEELKQYKEIKMEVVGRGNINEWMGNITYQIMIEGYEVTDGEYSF